MTIVEQLEKRITENEIWIPVPHLIISQSVEIGKIKLRTIDESLFDQWQGDWISRNPEHEGSTEQLFVKYRKRFQGRAAAYIKILAEPNRAEELAFMEAERSISILRYFDPAMQDPPKMSYCGLEGRYFTPRSFSIRTISDREPEFNEGYHGTLPVPWVLSPSYLGVIRSSGLDALGAILADENRTPFQKDILDSMFIYTKCALESDPINKLIFILAALESMLLRDTNEPLTQNVGERMAMYIGDSLADNKSLVADVKKVYRLRSSFLHHGKKREDITTLNRFMVNVWLLFNNLILDINHYQSRDEFIQALDDKKLSP
ncbi:MAG: hypothetical protein IIA59_13745 [Candidatus Marinimicrobia bacterium]|nr:hypothetical protein [Candidatus Neomarinimicrobiota bacterium]